MICYVILHYKNQYETINCVDSLKQFISSDSKIIIIDNGSNNGSFEELIDIYSGYLDVFVLSTNENLGFARGNNFGYCFAKERFNPELIVICNNDLLFGYTDFESKLLSFYEKEGFDVCGPDIINVDGIHQNPHRPTILSYKEIRHKNRNKIILLGILKTKKIFKRFFKNSGFIEKIIEKRYSSENKRILTLSDDIVLQGSCIAFGKRYVDNEDMAFDERTFLYFEEDLLALKCMARGYKTKVCLESKVTHLEGKSTGQSTANNIDKWIFIFENMIKSGKIYEMEIKKLSKGL